VGVAVKVGSVLAAALTGVGSSSALSKPLTSSSRMPAGVGVALGRGVRVA